MAVYKDNTTAMVIFAKASTPLNVETPNTINPDGSDMPFNPPTPNTPNVPTNNPSGSANGLTLKKAAQGLGVLQALRTTANYLKNNYGDIMQDSNAQATINETMNIVNMGIGIASGFAVGGVLGGIAMLGATALNVGLQTATWQRSLHRNSVQSEIMMARTQYASINGGR